MKSGLHAHPAEMVRRAGHNYVEIVLPAEESSGDVLYAPLCSIPGLLYLFIFFFSLFPQSTPYIRIFARIDRYRASVGCPQLVSSQHRASFSDKIGLNGCRLFPRFFFFKFA